MTVEIVPATSCSRVMLVDAEERSRKVEAEAPILPCEPIGTDAEREGKRDVVVFDVVAPLVSLRNSGSY